MFVAVGIREKHVGIDDALVEDDLVSLGFFLGRQRFGVGVAFDLVRVVDSDFPRLFFGLHDFIKDVLFQQFVSHLRLSPCVEREIAYLAFDFPLVSLVPIILGASGSKFDDMVARFKFVGEFSKVIS